VELVPTEAKIGVACEGVRDLLSNRISPSNGISYREILRIRVFGVDWVVWEVIRVEWD